MKESQLINCTYNLIPKKIPLAWLKEELIEKLYIEI